MPRLFVAIDIPDTVRESVANICHGVEQARWADMSTFHLTLQFIGDVDSGTAEYAALALSEVQAEPFGLALKGVGFFPPRRDVRVLWVGVDRCPELEALQREVCAALSDAGVEGDRRRFSPHITIARFRRPVPQHAVAPFVAAHGLFASAPFEVSEFHLYSSVLAKGGAVHTIEQSYPLAM